MPATRPRVPGWHPDPEDPAFLRHWDGKRWGRERRPRPSWAPLRPGVVPTAPLTGSSNPGPGADGGPPRRRWNLVAAAVVVAGLLLVALAAWLSDGPAIPPRSVGDVAFTERADALCADKLPALRADRPEAREDTGTDAEFASRIERAADGLADVTVGLRALPVDPADAAEVERWLDDWDAYVAVGRRYADRIRAGEKKATAEVEAEATRVSTRIFVFARANGMPACVL